MGLLEANVPETGIKVVKITDEQLKKDEAFGRLSPRRVVPVLAMPDGSAILESSAILLYIMETFDTAHKLHPAVGDAKRPLYLQAVAYVGAEAYRAVVGVFAECFMKPLEKRDRAKVDTAKEKYQTVVVEHLERHFADGRAYYLGSEFSAADIPFAYVLMTASFVEGEELLVSPTLTAYHSRLKERDSYKKLFSSDD